MSQVDEGLIHAWLDGQLKPDEAARVEQLVATNAAWGAAAAEARGLVAGASRILGALDHVPSVRTANAASTRAASDQIAARRRSWARAPWLRAAAAIVIVAGVGGVVWQKVNDQALTSAKEEVDKGADVAKPAAVAPVVAQEPRPSAKVPSTLGAGRSQQAGRNAPTESRVSARADDQRGASRPTIAPTGSAVTRPGAPVADAAAGVRIRDSVAPLPVATTATTERPLVAGGVGAGVGAATGGSVGGGGGGRGGRGVVAANDAQARLRALDEAAKSLSVPQEFKKADARLGDCWLPVDTGVRNAVNEPRDRDVFVLRFVEPVATDVMSQARLAAAAAPPASAARQIGRAETTVNARIQNTTARAVTDSTFTAEWITGAGRTLLSFSVRGDTIRGTTMYSAGDVSYPLLPFRAARTPCPR